MRNDAPPTLVPVSPHIPLGRRDKPLDERDSIRDKSGAFDLKALIDAKLRRDRERDKCGTEGHKDCPVPPCAVGQRYSASSAPLALLGPADLRSRYEERAALVRRDGQDTLPSAE